MLLVLCLVYCIDVVDMESDDEDIILLWWLKKIWERRRRRIFWIHPLINSAQNSYIVARELIRDPDKFQFYYRMKKETFDVLLHLVGPFLAVVLGKTCHKY